MSHTFSTPAMTQYFRITQTATLVTPRHKEFTRSSCWYYWEQKGNEAKWTHTHTHTHTYIYIYIKVKVKWSRYRPGVAQRVRRGIALLFHDRGTRREWVVSSTPLPHFTRYSFYRRLGGPQGRSGRAENLVPTRIRSRTVQPVVSRYTDWVTRTTRTLNAQHAHTHTHTHTYIYIYGPIYKHMPTAGGLCLTIGVSYFVFKLSVD